MKEAEEIIKGDLHIKKQSQSINETEEYKKAKKIDKSLKKKKRIRKK